MKIRTPQVPPQATLLALLLVSALSAAMLGCYAQQTAAGLSERAASQRIGDELVARLVPLFGDDVQGDLYPALVELRAQPSLALRWIAVRGADGVLLAHAGVFEHLRVPLLPLALQARLRENIQEWLWPARHRRLLNAQQRLLGEVEFGFARGAVAAADSRALVALRRVGWMLLALAALLLLAAGLIRRAARRASSQDELVHGGDIAPLGTVDEALRALAVGLVVVDDQARIRGLHGAAAGFCSGEGEDLHQRPLFSVLKPVQDDRTASTLAAIEARIAAAQPIPLQDITVLQRGGGSCRLRLVGAALPKTAREPGPEARARRPKPNGYALLLQADAPGHDTLAALRGEVELQRAVFDLLPEGVLITDLSGVVLDANAAIANGLGYPLEALVGTTVSKLMPVPFLNQPQIRIVHYADVARRAGLPAVVAWRRDATTFAVDLDVRRIPAVGGEHRLMVVVRPAQGEAAPQPAAETRDTDG